MIRKYVLPVLLVFLSFVIFFAVRYGIPDEQARIQSLSAIASSISAMVAVFVALWTDLKDRSYRQQERAEAQKKQVSARKRVAELYSAEIMAWLNRKDIQDFVTDLQDIEHKDSLQSSLKVFLISKRSVPAESNETDANIWQAEMGSEMGSGITLYTINFVPLL